MSNVPAAGVRQRSAEKKGMPAVLAVSSETLPRAIGIEPSTQRNAALPGVPTRCVPSRNESLPGSSLA